MSERDDEILTALTLTREALAQLEGVQMPTAGVLARALRAILYGQVALLSRLEELNVPAAPARTVIRPIPADRLEDDDEPIAPPTKKRAPPKAPPPKPAPEPEPLIPPKPAGEIVIAIESIQSEAIAVFPLEEVNRWLASGTIFQIRGVLAFLNLRSMGGLKVDEMRGHIRRMGYVDELGKLTAAGVEGEVLLFRKPD